MENLTHEWLNFHPELRGGRMERMDYCYAKSFEVVTQAKRNLYLVKSIFIQIVNGKKYVGVSVISVMISHEASTQDDVNKVIKECEQINELTGSQLSIFPRTVTMTTSPNGRRYSKHVLIFAAELICVSPAAYRMLFKMII